MAQSDANCSVYVQSEFKNRGKTKVTSEIRQGEVYAAALSIGSAPPVSYSLFRFLTAASSNGRVLLKPNPRPHLVRCCHVRPGGKKGLIRCDVSSAYLLEVAKKSDRLEYSDLQGNLFLTVRIMEAVPKRSVTFSVAREEDPLPAADQGPAPPPPGASVRVDIKFSAVEVTHNNTEPFLVRFNGVGSGWEFRRSYLCGHIPNYLAARISRSFFRVDAVAPDLATTLTLTSASFKGRVFRKDGTEEDIDGQFRLQPGDSAEFVGQRTVFGPDGEIAGVEYPPLTKGQFLSVSIHPPLLSDRSAGAGLDSMIDVDVLQDGEDDDEGYDTQPEDNDDRRFIDDGVGHRYTATYRVPESEARLMSQVIAQAVSCLGSVFSRPSDLRVPTTDEQMPGDEPPLEQQAEEMARLFQRAPRPALTSIDAVLGTMRSGVFTQNLEELMAAESDAVHFQQRNMFWEQTYRRRQRERLQREAAALAATHSAGQTLGPDAEL